ncbi:hypothetical protein [Mesorhizobium sp. M0220]|uniref:hypothetical protein n=1 Tax=unclassified Mesorhizobium TaxID=325217 RepID=UPI003339B20D
MILKRSWNAFWRKVDLPAAMVFIMAALAGVGGARRIPHDPGTHPRPPPRAW